MPSATPEKRLYRSQTREDKARRTRRRILAAAGAEFVARGYGAATIRSVAAAAGVSVATVELAFQNKPQLLRAAIAFAIRGDAEPVPMLARDWAARARSAATVAGFLAVVGETLTAAQQRSAGLVVAALDAARADESMTEPAAALRSQRAETAAWIVDGLISRAPLRDGLDRDGAIDTVWLLMDPHGYCALTRDRGWSPERFGAWFTDSVSRLLLDQSTTTRRPRRPTP